MVKHSTLLVNIVKANPRTEITCPDINDLVREVLQDTGVMLRTAKVKDLYYIERWNNFYKEMDEVERTRIDHRSFILRIDEQEPEDDGQLYEYYDVLSKMFNENPELEKQYYKPITSKKNDS